LHTVKTNLKGHSCFRRRVIAGAALVGPLLLYLAWLGMMGVHELGHVLHALLSGGRVARVSFPLLGFSQTFFSRNPHPYFVVWGGPLWGSILPVLAWGTTPRRWRSVRRAMQFFAGFCLIANGAYLGAGWLLGAGDAADLRKAGTSPAILIVFGVTAMVLGLYLWHRLGLADERQT
jgi:hypothetical protein